jgi:hypothetical protein
MTDAERIARLEAAVQSLTKLVSRHRPIPFGAHHDLRSLCLERWPGIDGGPPSMPHHAPAEEVPA